MAKRKMIPQKKRGKINPLPTIPQMPDHCLLRMNSREVIVIPESMHLEALALVRLWVSRGQDLHEACAVAAHQMRLIVYHERWLANKERERKEKETKGEFWLGELENDSIIGTEKEETEEM